MLPDDILQQAGKVIQNSFDKKLKITTAESCTGGLVAAALTSISGSSAVFERGFITYANEAKIVALNVPENILKTHGAVSAETAMAMAAGALKNAKADIAVSVTGIAGPGGGSPEKPVGLVFMALATRKGTEARRFQFEGDRAEVRRQATIKALSFLLSATKE